MRDKEIRVGAVKDDDLERPRPVRALSFDWRRLSRVGFVMPVFGRRPEFMG